MYKYNNINNSLKNEEKEIIVINRCDSKHTFCNSFSLKYINNINKLNEKDFNNFLNNIKMDGYNNCLSLYSNRNNRLNVLKLITNCSEKFNISYWDVLITNLSDDELHKIIENQIKYNNDFMNNVIFKDIQLTHYSNCSLINLLITTIPIKLKSFEIIFISFNLEQFNKYLDKIPINNKYIDDIIIKFYNQNNIIHFTKPENEKLLYKFLDKFNNNVNIIKHLFPLVKNSLYNNYKLKLFNSSISKYDKPLILLFLESIEIKPNNLTVEKLVEKTYNSNGGSSNKKIIAEIIDLLCDYGLIITKNIILKLLKHGCYINGFEKHGIPIDEEILLECAKNSYYPYKYKIIPPISVLLLECSKENNLNIIKELKEYGGIYTSECLVKACGIKKNGKIIKYLISCNVKVTDECLRVYQDTYGLEALDLLMINYNKNIPIVNNTKIIELNSNCLMNIEPKELEFKIDKDNDEILYEIKSKIKKLLEIKKDNISYNNLYELMLKYLITNKLVIGNYFVINNQLSNLLKMNHCSIFHIDELHNMLTYFIQ